MTPQIDIRWMEEGEEPLWGQLRTALWPDCLEAENLREAESFRNHTSALRLVLLAWAGDETIGFAEISERSVVDGCDGPQAYVEGWYVAEDYRRQNVGGQLIAAAAEWARAKNYDALASDVELHNPVSQQAHVALGFEETGRVVNYVKLLRP